MIENHSDKFYFDPEKGFEQNTSAAEAMQQLPPSVEDLMQDLKERQYTPEGMASQVTDHSAEIKKMMAEQKAWQRAVKNLITKTVNAAADGNMVVPSYNPSRNAKQEVLVYNSKYWKLIDCQLFYDFAKECCQKIGLPDIYLTDSSFMKGIYDDVAHDLAHNICHPEHPGEVWINLQNGTLKVNRKGEIKLDAHRREDYFHYVLPYSYDPKATCEMWQRFLDQVLPDRSVQSVLGEYLGYCFTNGIKAEKMLVLQGSGSNGKSVVMDVIEGLVGSANVSNVTLAKLTQDEKMRCEIENKLVNISTESNKELETSTLKILVSGEPVMAYKNYIGPRTLTNYAKLITSYNTMPKAEATHGFYRRFLIIPFMVTISKKEEDLDLAKKLMVELPGILNWVIEGLQRFLQNYSFSECAACDEALQNYRLNSDSVRLFVNECCEIDNTFPSSGPWLYNQYKIYCSDTGTHYVGRNEFYKRLMNSDVECKEYQRNKSFNLAVISNNYGSTTF